MEIILNFYKNQDVCCPSRGNRFTEVKYWMWNLYRKKRVKTTALSAHYLSTMFGWVVMVDKKNFWLRHCYFNNFHFISTIFLHISYIYVRTLHYFMRCIWQVLGCKKLRAMSSALKICCFKLPENLLRRGWFSNKKNMRCNPTTICKICQ